MLSQLHIGRLLGGLFIVALLLTQGRAQIEIGHVTGKAPEDIYFKDKLNETPFLPVIGLQSLPKVVGDFLRSLIHDQLHDQINIVQWESFHDQRPFLSGERNRYYDCFVHFG
jgi:hypothetical protein